MRIELLVSKTCAVCAQAEAIWRNAGIQRDAEFCLVDIDEPHGNALSKRLNLRSIPAVVIDGELVGVGVQTPEQAGALLDRRRAAKDSPAPPSRRE